MKIEILRQPKLYMEPEVAREFVIPKGLDGDGAGVECDANTNGEVIADRVDNYTPGS